MTLVQQFSCGTHFMSRVSDSQHAHIDNAVRTVFCEVLGWAHMYVTVTACALL